MSDEDITAAKQAQDDANSAKEEADRGVEEAYRKTADEQQDQE